ncbi:MAG: ribosome recycling factor [Gammaproteobacteria bacterium]|nr:ribosome recycling factor [Gammaproteobacteria bacterium]
MSLQTILKEAGEHMQKAIEALKADLIKLRTGRAHPSLLEHIKVACYGGEMPLAQLANIHASDAKTLAITPWDKALVEAIEKAIMTSDLGLNPTTAGGVIRVSLPPLTEERRHDIIRLVKEMGEKTRVNIRNVRRDANHHLKNLEKEKQLSEDEEHRSENDIQKLTDKIIKEVDVMVEKKEQELLEIG